MIFSGYGMFLNDELIAVIPAPPRMLDPTWLKNGVSTNYQGQAPVLTAKAEEEGYRWAPLFEAKL